MLSPRSPPQQRLVPRSIRVWSLRLLLVVTFRSSLPTLVSNLLRTAIDIWCLFMKRPGSPLTPFGGSRAFHFWGNGIHVENNGGYSISFSCARMTSNPDYCSKMFVKG